MVCMLIRSDILHGELVDYNTKGGYDSSFTNKDVLEDEKNAQKMFAFLFFNMPNKAQKPERSGDA